MQIVGWWLQAQRLQAVALMHQRQYGRAEARLLGAMQAAQHARPPPRPPTATHSDANHSGRHGGALSGAASLADGASTVAGTSVYEGDEDAKGLLFDLTLRVSAACHAQGKLREAVRAPCVPPVLLRCVSFVLRCTSLWQGRVLEARRSVDAPAPANPGFSATRLLCS